jgi:CheY-like chemotaxis protein
MRPDQLSPDRPMSGQFTDAKASPHKLQVHALQGLRILLVEDQPLNQDVVVGVLRAEGGIVEVADNGAQALQRLQTEAGPSYDAVLMDVQMPLLDGYETTRRIREHLGRRDLPIIAMTAHAYADEGRRCRAAGMNDCLFKPVDIEHLFQVLRRWCRSRRAGRDDAHADRTSARGRRLATGTAPRP